MKIAVIGTGALGSTLGALWAEANHEVVFGSREQARAEQLAQTVGAGSAGMQVAAACAWCEAALLAVPWFAFTDIERLIGEQLDGKVLLDCINPLRSSGSLAPLHGTSAAEEIARTLYRAQVVKAFNHIHPQTLRAPRFDGQAATMFYCSNEDRAKRVAQQLATQIGLEPVDAGPLKNARLLEPLAALWGQLAFTTHHGRDIAFKLLQRS